MRILLKILFLAPLFTNVKAQILFYQDTYKGGVTSDGVAYRGFDYLQSDTINFQLHIPSGSTIRKAFLFSDGLLWFYNTPYTKDGPVLTSFNNSPLLIDSSSRISNFFHCDYSVNSGTEWITVNDVTSYIQNTSNTLIIPCQTCLMTADPNRRFAYDGFLLVVMYEDATLPNVNPVIYLNNKTYGKNMTYPLTGFNPISTTNDVGLSIYTNDAAVDSISYTLASTMGSFYLGSLGLPATAAASEFDYAPGSFYYENSTLSGLRDDSPNLTVDTTDALANIKSYLANNSTTFTVNLTASTNPGCWDLTSAFVLAYTSPCPPLNNIPLQSYKICSLGGSVQLMSGSGGNTYKWYPGYGLSDSTIANPVASPTVSTNYILTVKDINGCSHTEHYKVNIEKAPSVDSLIIIPPVCGNLPVVLGTCTVVTPATLYNPYTYDIGSGGQSGNTFSNLNAGNYTLSITDNVGCSLTKPFTIPEINPAIATFSLQPIPACVNELVNFYNTSGGTNQYWWGVNGDTTNIQNPTYVFTDTGSYNITLIAWHNLRRCADTVTHTIQVEECPPDSINITTPNVFTPNGDDINETWLPILYNLGFTINDFSLTIFDRWGLKVFESTESKNGWDGRITSGIACTEGTYFYVLKYRADNSKGQPKEQTLKGFLQLAR